MHIQTPHLHIHPITYKHTQSLSFVSKKKSLIILKPKKKTKHTTHPIANLQIILKKFKEKYQTKQKKNGHDTYP